MGWNVSVDYENDPEFEMHEDCPNFTHNCNGMMRAALDATGNLVKLGENHLYALSGKVCGQVAGMLGPALLWWRKNPESMAEFVPKNGWGSAEEAFGFWVDVYNLCVKHPNAVIRMGG